jgi:hypothetical protein
MIGWLARMALLRVLPAKLVPILTVLEVARFLRGARNKQRARAAEQAEADALRRARWVGASGPAPGADPAVDPNRTGTGL